MTAAAVGFLLHGAGTLLLQSAWIRAQTAAFGATPAAPGSVLAAYFAGVTIGSWFWRRGEILAPRALFPLAAALLPGALIPWLPSLATRLAVAGGAGWALSAGALWIAAAALVLPSCVAIGAFLPLLGRAGGERASVLLYGMEALGALPGVLLGSLLLPRLIGCRATAVAGTAAILLAWWVFRYAGLREPAGAAEAPSPGGDGPPPARLLWLAAGSGVFSLVLEPLWIRLIALRSDNSVAAFGAVTFLTLVLFAAASLLVARLPDPLVRSRHALAALLPAIVAGGIAAAGLWLRLTGGLSIRLIENASGLGASFRLAAPLIVVGSLAASLLLPLLLRLAAAGGGDRAGAVGALIAANGLGCAGGAALASFVLLPRLGVWATLLVALAGYLALLAFAERGRSRIAAVAAGALLIGAFNPLRNPVVTPTDPYGGPPGEVVSVAEGAHGVVAVVDYPGRARTLWLNNTYLLEAFTGDSRATARLGVLPTVLRPDAENAAMIGVGTGVSASGLREGVAGRIDLVELIPEVAEAARRHFGEHNRGVLEDPRVRLAVDDGRRFLARSGARYDIIATDLVTPWNEGAAALYTREHFDVVRARLRPAGIFCLWLPLFQVTREELLIIARTMADVFPSVTLWQLGSRSEHAVAALVGAGRIDLGAIAAGLRTRPRAPGEPDPLLLHESGVISHYLGPVDTADPLWRGVPLNTLDRPLVELLAARGGRRLLKGREFLDLAAEFHRQAANPGGRFFTGWSAAADDWRMIGRDLTRYAWYLETGDYGRAAALEARISSLPAFREAP